MTKISVSRSDGCIDAFLTIVFRVTFMSQVASKSLNESVREMLTFREATHLKIK